MKKDKLCYLKPVTYPGCSHSIHYWGRIYFQEDIKDVERKLTKIEAEEMNTLERKRRIEMGLSTTTKDYIWKEHYINKQFIDKEMLYNVAKIMFRRDFVSKGASLLVVGDPVFYEVMEVIDSIPECDNLKNILNDIYKEFEPLYNDDEENNYDEILVLKGKYYAAISNYEVK